MYVFGAANQTGSTLIPQTSRRLQHNTALPTTVFPLGLICPIRGPLTCVLSDVLRPASLCSCCALWLVIPSESKVHHPGTAGRSVFACALYSVGYSKVTKLFSSFHHQNLINCCHWHIPPLQIFYRISDTPHTGKHTKAKTVTPMTDVISLLVTIRASTTSTQATFTATTLCLKINPHKLPAGAKKPISFLNMYAKNY